jgi:hypothetical protein
MRDEPKKVGDHSANALAFGKLPPLAPHFASDAHEPRRMTKEVKLLIYQIKMAFTGLQ